MTAAPAAAAAVVRMRPAADRLAARANAQSATGRTAISVRPANQIGRQNPAAAAKNIGNAAKQNASRTARSRRAATAVSPRRSAPTIAPASGAGVGIPEK